VAIAERRSDHPVEALARAQRRRYRRVGLDLALVLMARARTRHPG
jgi:hypothetical protein